MAMLSLGCLRRPQWGFFLVDASLQFGDICTRVGPSLGGAAQGEKTYHKRRKSFDINLAKGGLSTAMHCPPRGLSGGPSCAS